MRPRNTVLACLHLFKALDPRVSVNEVMAFLYVCENEGLTVQDLAVVGRLTQSTASRSLRAWARGIRSGRCSRRWALCAPTCTPATAAATWSSSPNAASTCAIASTA